MFVERQSYCRLIIGIVPCISSVSPTRRRDFISPRRPIILAASPAPSPSAAPLKRSPSWQHLTASASPSLSPEASCPPNRSPLVLCPDESLLCRTSPRFHPPPGQASAAARGRVRQISVAATGLSRQSLFGAGADPGLVPKDWQAINSWQSLSQDGTLQRRCLPRR